MIDIDDVLDKKLEMLHRHTSQVYEWLPFNEGRLAEVPAGESERRSWLRARYAPQFAALADRFRDALIRTYGAERGAAVRYAEAVEVSEYGAPLTAEARRRLFPFLP